MRNGKTIAQRAAELGFASKSDDLVHDLLDALEKARKELEAMRLTDRLLLDMGGVLE